MKAAKLPQLKRPGGTAIKAAFPTCSLRVYWPINFLQKEKVKERAG